MDKIILKVALLAGIFCAMFINAQTIYSKKYIRVEYNEKWTKDSLIAIQERLKTNYKFDVKFSDVSYKGDFVDTFTIDVNTKDGYSGGASLGNKLKGYAFGFFRDYRKSSLVQFSIGHLKKQ